MAHILSDSFRTISDYEGHFSIPASFVKDSISITNVAYQDYKFVPIQQKGDTIFMVESLTVLNTLVITNRSPAQLLFDAVDNMKKLRRAETILNADYWSGVFQNDTLVGLEVASILVDENGTTVDTVVSRKICTEYILESFSNIDLIWKQNHVEPELSCLNRKNEDLWSYELKTLKNHLDNTEAKINANFISTSNSVNHEFEIWLSIEDEIINRIEFSYQWNVRKRSMIKGKLGKYSTLKELSGTVIFDISKPVLINSKYTYEICDINKMINCQEQIIYHELKSKSISAKTINKSIYNKLELSLNCN